MGNPRAVLEVAFEPLYEEPYYVDISEDLNPGWWFDRGRSEAGELQRMEAGRGVFPLHNWHGKYDNRNTSSPYVGRIKPMRRGRLKVEVDNDGTSPFRMGSSRVGGGHRMNAGVWTIDLFSFFVETWGMSWPEGGFDAVVTMKVVDGFKLFALSDFLWGQRYTGSAGNEVFVCGLPSGTNVTPGTGPPFIPDDRSDVRIQRVIDCVGWPGETDLDVGNVTILGSDQDFGGTTNIFVSGKGLTHLLDIAATEVGEVFIDRQGRLAFRNAAYDPEVAAVFGDGAGEHPYEDLTLQDDEAYLWNEITASAQQQGSSTAVAAGSAEEFGPRERAFSFLTTADIGISQRAAIVLDRYSQPAQRVIGLRPLGGTPAEWAEIFTRELGDKITVVRRPDNSDAITQTSRLEGMHVASVSDADWDISWRVSKHAERTFEVSRSRIRLRSTATGSAS